MADFEPARRASRRFGATEATWKGIPEERRLLWKVATCVIAFAASMLVEKCGIRVIDNGISALCALATLTIVESQRNFSKYSPRFRKRLIRVAIAVPTSIAVALGSSYFLAIAAAMARSAADTLLASHDAPHSASNVLAFAIALVVLPVTALHVSRRTQFEGLISDVPRRLLFELVSKRRFVARHEAECLVFEGSVLVMSYACSSALSGIVALIARTILH